MVNRPAIVCGRLPGVCEVERQTAMSGDSGQTLAYELEELQQRPFMRHLESNSDHLQLVHVQLCPGNSSPEPLQRPDHRQNTAVFHVLACRGVGQAMVTFWPQNSSQQDAAANRLCLDLPEAALDPVSPHGRLTQVLSLLGHQVVLSGPGLVDVSIKPLGLRNKWQPPPPTTLLGAGVATAWDGSSSSSTTDLPPLQEPEATAGRSYSSSSHGSRPKSPLSRHSAPPSPCRTHTPKCLKRYPSLVQQLAAKAAHKAGLPSNTHGSKHSSFTKARPGQAKAKRSALLPSTADIPAASPASPNNCRPSTPISSTVTDVSSLCTAPAVTSTYGAASECQSSCPLPGFINRATTDMDNPANPYQLAPSDLAFVQQWLLWDELHNRSNATKSEYGICHQIAPHTAVRDSDGLPVASCGELRYPGTFKGCPDTEDASPRHQAESAADEAGGCGVTEGCWGSRRPTAEDAAGAATAPTSQVSEPVLLAGQQKAVQPAGCTSNASRTVWDAQSVDGGSDLAAEECSCSGPDPEEPLSCYDADGVWGSRGPTAEEAPAAAIAVERLITALASTDQVAEDLEGNTYKGNNSTTASKPEPMVPVAVADAAAPVSCSMTAADLAPDEVAPMSPTVAVPRAHPQEVMQPVDIDISQQHRVQEQLDDLANCYKQLLSYSRPSSPSCTGNMSEPVPQSSQPHASCTLQRKLAHAAPLQQPALCSMPEASDQASHKLLISIDQPLNAEFSELSSLFSPLDSPGYLQSTSPSRWQLNSPSGTVSGASYRSQQQQQGQAGGICTANSSNILSPSVQDAYLQAPEQVHNCNELRGALNWAEDETMWQQIRHTLQELQAIECLQLQSDFHQQHLQLQQEYEQLQEQLQDLLDCLRDQRIAEERYVRLQELQEQLQDELILGTKGFTYPSISGTDEITYEGLQQLIGQHFAAQIQGDGVKLAAMTVPKFWMLSDAAAAELVQWVWEECLDRKLGGLNMQEPLQQTVLQPVSQQLSEPQVPKDPVCGILRMHHNLSRGLAAAVAEHARSAAEVAVQKFLNNLAGQRQRDAARFGMLELEVAETDPAALAQRDYDLGVEWRYNLYKARQGFQNAQALQRDLLPILQQQSLQHDLALYAATKARAVQDYQRSCLLAQHSTSMLNSRWEENNRQQDEAASSVFSKARLWFVKAVRGKKFKQFLQQQKHSVQQKEKQRRKNLALDGWHKQTGGVAGQQAD